ncbi:Lrp/AsnC family transcriptional regulator [Tsuneonella amylolytica]|uniref:Lrp/AsnC family transcriptional regulator n=1 Tax=Tsuneonella amylolytica TaxID=2338327 RepID=UPI000EA9F0E3|nr:Lrp/AsnC family transcriptional regulator [Tsuneonella amylolytica]
MPVRIDTLDRKILRLLQQDATRPLDEIAQEVGSSKTPVWNRIRKMREAGVIDRQVAVLDPAKVGLGSCFFVLVRTARHDAEWLASFTSALEARPEIVEAHRLAGEIDYLIKVRVADAAAYDRFYRALIEDVSIFSVTALLSMEEMIATTALPLGEPEG